LALGLSLPAFGQPAQSQYPGQQPGQQPTYPSRPETTPQRPAASQTPNAEQQAALKVEAAPGTAEKLQAAAEFIKKYPKSTIRLKVAQHVGANIAANPDAAQRITFSENYLTVFTDQSEANIINPILLDSYIKAKRMDDAFRVAATVFVKTPEDVSMLTQMALVGTNEVRQGNPKFVQQSQQYGIKAIELIEADKRGEIDLIQWGEFKTKWLGHLYQSMGILSLVSQNRADAKAKLEKSAALIPDDPFTYALIGQIINDDYQQLAQKYKAMQAGPARDEALKQLHGLIDKMIDLYVQSVALSEGNVQYQPLRDQVFQDLESYYKYRNNGSVEGLQQLIAKYKKAPTGQ
jgi:hypothetical protein